MDDLKDCQGTVVGFIHDQVLVRYESFGVIFLKKVLTRQFKVDDIVRFSAKKANACDIAVSEQLSRSTKYDVRWTGTEIKFIKAGRSIQGHGKILTIDAKGQFLFVDWSFTAKPPKIGTPKNNSNVFCTKATVRPECENARDIFKIGQHVRFIAKEQAPSKTGVCWRAAILTDEENEIDQNEVNGRIVYTIRKKGMSRLNPAAGTQPVRGKGAEKKNVAEKKAWQETTNSIPQTASQSSSSKSVIEKPPPVGGFDFYDCSVEAVKARYEAFVKDYRTTYPQSILSQPLFEGILQLNYLQHVDEQMAILRVAHNK